MNTQTNSKNRQKYTCFDNEQSSYRLLLTLLNDYLMWQ